MVMVGGGVNIPACPPCMAEYDGGGACRASEYDGGGADGANDILSGFPQQTSTFGKTPDARCVANTKTSTRAGKMPRHSNNNTQPNTNNHTSTLTTTHPLTTQPLTTTHNHSQPLTTTHKQQRLQAHPASLRSYGLARCAAASSRQTRRQNIAARAPVPDHCNDPESAGTCLGLGLQRPAETQ